MTSSSKTNSPKYKRKTVRIRIKSPTYVNLESSSEKHHNERTPSPPLRKKSLSPPHAPSKSTSSRSTYQTISSFTSESPTPTHVAPPPKLRFVIPLKLEPQELPPQQTLPHNPHVSTMDNWLPIPSNPSPPPLFSHPPSRLEHPPPPQPLFVNINNNIPQQENLSNLPPNLGNQQLPNPPNILDFIHPNDLPHLHNMFCQCTDNRPPMLIESDYESWKIRIERYIREGQGDTTVQVIRDKTDEEFTVIENNRELADIQATNILSQGLPRHVFNILNQTRTGKEIWDNVELRMKGSGKSFQQKKEELFDEYERFRAIGNESIHDYFVRFHKLINDMKITQLNIPTHQMNTKFVNNLPPYWAKYVTNVKNNKDISATTYVELYTYLKSYEPHAMKTLKKQEQSSSIADPLAYLASTTHHHTPTQTTTPLPSTSSLTLSPQPAAQSSNDAMLATMNQIVNLLSGFQKQFPPTNNQLRTSSNSRSHATVHDGKIVTETVQRRAPGNVGNTGNRGIQSYGQMTDNKGKKVICYNCRGEGHVARQCKEKKRVMDSQYFKDKMLLMEAKEKGAILDAEAEAFLADVECTAPYDEPLAITTTNVFEVSHEDAYDSDIDEGPHAAAAFMANLSSTSATNSQVNEVHSNDNKIFNNVNDQMSQEMQQEEHSDFDAENEIDENTISYDQYLLDKEAQRVPTEISVDTSDKMSMIAILTDLQIQLDGHAKVNQEKCLEIETLKNELLQCKQEI
ncbi:retrovirus-related pol polyprotein from transposon TNT 1-94, partial [Tanacetum coccineum]